MIVAQTQGTQLIREVVDRLSVRKNTLLLDITLFSVMNYRVFFSHVCLLQLVSEVRKGGIKDKIIDLAINIRSMIVTDVERKVGNISLFYEVLQSTDRDVLLLINVHPHFSLLITLPPPPPPPPTHTPLLHRSFFFSILYTRSPTQQRIEDLTIFLRTLSEERKKINQISVMCLNLLILRLGNLDFLNHYSPIPMTIHVVQHGNMLPHSPLRRHQRLQQPWDKHSNWPTRGFRRQRLLKLDSRT